MSKKYLTDFLFASCFISLLSQPLFAKSDSLAKYHEITRWNLGGEGGWDYLTADSISRRLYIARNNRIMVVDLDSGKLKGEVPETEGAHGIALIPPLGLGFATAGRGGSITVFDLKTLKKTDAIKGGDNPDAILYDSQSQQVFVFNGKSKNMTVIDPKSKKVLDTTPLSGKPEFAVSNEGGRIFVNIEDQNKLAAIDTKGHKVIAEYPLAPCEEPTGLSINSNHQHLYVGCSNKMVAIVDANSSKVIKTIPAGQGIDATAFNSKLNLAFVSAGEGRLTVVNDGLEKDIVLAQDLKTEKGARTLAIDSETGHVLLATAKFGETKHSVLPNSFYVIVLGQ